MKHDVRMLLTVGITVTALMLGGVKAEAAADPMMPGMALTMTAEDDQDRFTAEQTEQYIRNRRQIAERNVVSIDSTNVDRYYVDGDGMMEINMLGNSHTLELVGSCLDEEVTKLALETDENIVRIDRAIVGSRNIRFVIADLSDEAASIIPGLSGAAMFELRMISDDEEITEFGDNRIEFGINTGLVGVTFGAAAVFSYDPSTGLVEILGYPVNDAGQTGRAMFSATIGHLSIYGIAGEEELRAIVDAQNARTAFCPLIVKATANADSHTLTWDAFAGADSYAIYAGTGDEELKLVGYLPSAGRTGCMFTVANTGSDVKVYRVIAEQNGEEIGWSQPVALVGADNKTYTNVGEITLTSTQLMADDARITFEIHPEIVSADDSKQMVNSDIRYISTNPMIASVDDAGIVKLYNPGTCTVYAVTANGLVACMSINRE